MARRGRFRSLRASNVAARRSGARRAAIGCTPRGDRVHAARRSGARRAAIRRTPRGDPAHAAPTGRG
jgi:hypothetical protein